MTDNKLKIHSIETFGTQEGPGIRFVIFVQGCNFKCLYCHNPDTQITQFKIQNSKFKINEFTISELVKMVERSKPYFGSTGGVTISGGEPLLQAKAILDLFKKLKKCGIHTALDTNGSILNETTKELLQYTDLVLLDIKHFNPEWHDKVTKTKCQGTVPSLTFLDYLESIKKPVWIRYVLVPDLTNQPNYCLEMAEFLNKFNVIERIEILPYHTLGISKYEKLGWNYELANCEPPTAENIEKSKDLISKSGKLVIIR